MIVLFQYDASVPGGHGGGGEYEIQMGFGWTNGVILELLDKYGYKISLTDDFETSEEPVMSDSWKPVSCFVHVAASLLFSLVIRNIF